MQAKLNGHSPVEYR
ncbi:hypothetical protein [Weissella confusa]